MGKKRADGDGDEYLSVGVSIVQDVEEGEISDSASVEEISAEDFVVKAATVATTPLAAVVAQNNNNNSSDPKQQHTKVWTMQDLMKYQNKYQVSRNYGAGLYNFAWAQAVQNKPLDDYLTTLEFNNNKDSNPKNSSSSNAADSTLSKEGGEEVRDDKVVIDVSGDEDEKEEGELEEGEIDLDTEIVEESGSVKKGEEDGKEQVGLMGNELCGDHKASSSENNLKELIREGLEAVTMNDAQNSFSGVCSKLCFLLGNLSKLVSANSGSKMDDLVRLSFSGIQIVNSVFCSLHQTQKRDNRDIFSRLLTQVINQRPPLFPPGQMKEVEVMFQSSDLHAVSSSTTDAGAKERSEIQFNQNNSDVSANNVNPEVASLKEECVIDDMSIETSHWDAPRQMDLMKIETSSSRSRLLLPILDLHKDHDADSLPSPTRETSSQLSLGKAFFGGDRVIKPEWPSPHGAFETKSPAMHRYETDALKAVSSYQQKFGRTSFLTSNRLPSPTPSDESDDAGGDTGGEVSSSLNVPNASSPIDSTFTPPSVFPLSRVESTGEQSLLSARTTPPVSSTSAPLVRVAIKSRDPRLRFANFDSNSVNLNQLPSPSLTNQPMVDPLDGMLSSRKQKSFDQPVLSDRPAPKRQKSELTDSEVRRDMPAVSQTGGWLEDRGSVGLPVPIRNSGVESMRIDPRGLENVVTSSISTNGVHHAMINGGEHIPVTNANATPSLQSLLKDIAVNPSMWMNIIKMEQQKSIDSTKHATQSPNINAITTAVPMMATTLPRPLVVEQRSSPVQQKPQAASMDDLGKIRMKARDPRRALHNNPKKVVNMGLDIPNANLSDVQGIKGSLKQEEQLDKVVVSSSPITPPDFTRQFTKNLKNIADIVSGSQTTVSPMVPQTPLSQPAQVHPSHVNIKGSLSEPDNLEGGPNKTSDEVVAGPQKSQNMWGDVEHLFEGYDDQQKAAIQKERARRMEEQKKMFSGRKLCLVLDLDHTLLNSAKFAEIEPMHEEMLKKKEEQDREKPYRHLFRFPHMGMWTKLRPGIWNFLEKASKLYELHLYTMGNKLYATEMAKVLDPSGALFNGRVISKGDDTDLIDGDERAPKSKDLEGVLGMESAVVIIDDSIRVWPHNKLNLIVVERYIYFPCSRRQFGLPGPSLLEIDHDERPEDGTLASSLAVIERIHQNFFLQKSLDDADVRNILATEQRKILGGCRILFSRVFPVGEANPHLHPLWQTAEQFGAVCTNQIDEQVTHVVANSLGTDKVNWAFSTGRFVVHPGWVEASALLYRRASEQEFAVKP